MKPSSIKSFNSQIKAFKRRIPTTTGLRTLHNKVKNVLPTKSISKSAPKNRSNSPQQPQPIQQQQPCNPLSPQSYHSTTHLKPPSPSLFGTAVAEVTETTTETAIDQSIAMYYNDLVHVAHNIQYFDTITSLANRTWNPETTTKILNYSTLRQISHSEAPAYFKLLQEHVPILKDVSQSLDKLQAVQTYFNQLAQAAPKNTITAQLNILKPTSSSLSPSTARATTTTTTTTTLTAQTQGHTTTSSSIQKRCYTRINKENSTVAHDNNESNFVHTFEDKMSPNTFPQQHSLHHHHHLYSPTNSVTVEVV